MQRPSARLVLVGLVAAACAAGAPNTGTAGPREPAAASAPPTVSAPTAAIGASSALVGPGGSSSPSPPISPAPSAGVSASASVEPSAVGGAGDRVAGWRSDLAALLPAMDARHPNLTHGIDRATLENAVAALATDVPSLTDDAVMVGLLRIVGLVSSRGHDAHTGAFIWGEGTYPVHNLPLRLWLFPDGLYVVGALDPYRDLVGARVERIGDRPTIDVLALLDPLLPRDNDETVRLLLPRFLMMPEVLHGLGLVNGQGPVALSVREAVGSERTVEVAPIDMAAYNDWAGTYGLHLPDDPLVPSLARTQEPLWWDLDAAGRTLFVQYNRVTFVDRTTINALAEAMAAPRLTRIVLDLRQNYGGEVSAYRPLLAALETSDTETSGRLFVITGRNTYSAASLLAAELDQDTSARFVGEPMGGSPTLFGNSEPVSLPYSGIVVEVATTLEDPVPGDDRLTIEPDIAAPMTAADYFGHRDPALARILALP